MTYGVTVADNYQNVIVSGEKVVGLDKLSANIFASRAGIRARCSRGAVGDVEDVEV